MAGLGLILLAPLLLLVALAIKWDDGGPVLFRQVRIGQNGIPFGMWKFRSMVVDAARRGGELTVAGDPRITRVGGFLRQHKIDELPQLLNVLVGDMALVGPRPEVPHYVAAYRPEQREVLRLKPGITDPASLQYHDEAGLLAQCADPEAFYVRELMPEKIRLNLAYARQASLASDLMVILRTVAELLPSAGRGGRSRAATNGVRLAPEPHRRVIAAASSPRVPPAPAGVAPRPAVSVVMPLYDKADYVAAAVTSVLAQLGASDEIVVVNDGSTDRGPDIVRAIGDPRIRLIDQANAGKSAARNRGVREARNDWIAFLDADDMWRPGKLDRQLAILQRSPQLTWAAGGFERVSGDRVLEQADPLPDAWFQGDGILSDGLAVLAAGRYLWIGTVVARRTRLLALGGFDTELRIGPDVLMCVRLALADPQLAYVRQPVALYRWGLPGSMMQQSIGRSMAEADLLDRRLLAIAPTVPPDRAALCVTWSVGV